MEALRVEPASDPSAESVVSAGSWEERDETARSAADAVWRVPHLVSSLEDKTAACCRRFALAVDGHRARSGFRRIVAHRLEAQASERDRRDVNEATRTTTAVARCLPVRIRAGRYAAGSMHARHRPAVNRRLHLHANRRPTAAIGRGHASDAGMPPVLQMELELSLPTMGSSPRDGQRATSTLQNLRALAPATSSTTLSLALPDHDSPNLGSGRLRGISRWTGALPSVPQPPR